MHNSDTTIGENVRYFMYKYKMIGLMIFLIIFKRIDNQIQNTTQLDDICLTGAIRQLCEAHDNGIVQFVDLNHFM